MFLRCLVKTQPGCSYKRCSNLKEKKNMYINLQYRADEAYSPITSVKQYENNLYFGSLTHAGWGKIEIPK